jgi:beta-lactam-binding protein with PASTA domain
MSGGWRAAPRRLLPYLVVGGSGFLLAYVAVYLFVFPSAVIPTDRPVPDVRGLLEQDADRALRDAGFSPQLGERRVNASVVPNTVTGQRPAPAARKPRGAVVVYDLGVAP